MPVPRPIRPWDLVRHADQLANHHPRQGRPRGVWLRRSTSASYYAVFHAVALAVAGTVAPNAAESDRQRLARSVDHGRLAEVCRWIDGAGEGREHVRPIVRRLRGNAGLVELAATFTRLQAARHQADYDHLADVIKADAVRNHDEAVRAIRLVESLTPTADGQEFLALVALHTSLR